MSRRYRYKERINGQAMAVLRKRIGLTLNNLARLTGVDARRLERCEKGEEAVPVHVQRDLQIWLFCPHDMANARAWADEFAEVSGDRNSQPQEAQ